MPMPKVIADLLQGEAFVKKVCSTGVAQNV
jgi:hypothetical protein